LKVKARFYIRATGATPSTQYWMQRAKKFTVSPFSATLFDTEAEAEAELMRAHIQSAAEVCQQIWPAAKVIQYDGPLTKLRKATAINGEREVS
jgi:hypothetical protein